MIDPAEQANRESALGDAIEKRLQAIADSGRVGAEMVAVMLPKLRVIATQIGREVVREGNQLTAEARRLVLLGVAAGLPVYVACELAGISRSTWNHNVLHHPGLREALEQARMMSVGDIEATMEGWIATKTPDGLPTMAQVKTAEALLSGRDPRYRRGGAGARMQLTTPNGTFNASVGGPGD